MRRLVVPLAGNFIMMALGLAATKLMATAYAPADFGLVAYVNGLTIIFAAFADLGLGVVHMKRLGDGANVRDCVRVYLTVKTALLLGLLSGVLLVGGQALGGRTRMELPLSAEWKPAG